MGVRFSHVVVPEALDALLAPNSADSRYPVAFMPTLLVGLFG